MNINSYIKEEPFIPDTWSNCPGLPSKDALRKFPDTSGIVDIDPKSMIHKTIQHLFTVLWKDTDVHFEGVQRIENFETFHFYSRIRKIFCEKKLYLDFPNLREQFDDEDDVPSSGDDFAYLNKELIPEINERYLFHGTQTCYIPAICKQGFDTRVSTQGMFGTGTYFAELPIKADEYTYSYTDPQPERVMVLSRVILGHIGRCDANHRLRRPVCTLCNETICNHAICDSIMGTHKNRERLSYREFVIYDQFHRTYPEYIIHYKNNSSSANSAAYWFRSLNANGQITAQNYTSGNTTNNPALVNAGEEQGGKKKAASLCKNGHNSKHDTDMFDTERPEQNVIGCDVSNNLVEVTRQEQCSSCLLM